MCGSFSSPMGAQEAPKDPPVVEPTPEQIQRARQSGRDDGRPDGQREGQERAPLDGERLGSERGQSQGYNECFDRERRSAEDAGYAEGYREGERVGEREGFRRGEDDGEEQGIRAGRADGDQRANRDADREASPRGRARGIEEANSSDAEDRGYGDGLEAGDVRAQETARRVDYARGRKDYREAQFAEAIENRDSFAQKAPLVVTAPSRRGFQNEMMSFLSQAPGSDCRYCNPRRSFGTSKETEAYRSGYTEGYNSGFKNTYDQLYPAAYDRAFKQGTDRGCKEAMKLSYRKYFESGSSRGYDEGYSSAYRRAYDRSFRIAYDENFRDESDEMYSRQYDSYYQQHYESARSLAYRDRVNVLYKRGFDRGDDEKFQDVYPVYAAQQYDRGQSDEASDFESRPVRLLSAAVTETIQNGLFEPGEPLRLKVDLRNFSRTAIDSRDLVLEVASVNATGVSITEASSVLVRGLNPKSLTQVSEALEFVLPESLVDKAVSLKVTARYRGQESGESVVQITPQFHLALSFAEAPKLTEGMRTVLKVKVRNQSPQGASGPLTLEILTNSDKIEILKREVVVNSLAVGATTIVEFAVIGRTSEINPRIPLVILATNESARRVGLLDFSGQIPTVNDYKISVSGSAQSLRSSGVTRIPYTIRNISSRLLFKGLQLQIRVLEAEDPEAFAILGRNPQYLTPLENGQSLSFVFPILAKRPNKGAVIELEVQEDGRTTVVHRFDFKEMGGQ